ncbi:hypothetical protein KUTeg_005976 [Tegillarca granosa]|uniref:Ubiquitin-like domain-containing protein n=1 Tax=Tegillarca granosa TaxID=220873 RepID=A0ABQ9FHG2_TEGGR|nr:hypothetical protein KUTeg_005976 [Tegillarca granosa]
MCITASKAIISRCAPVLHFYELRDKVSDDIVVPALVFKTVQSIPNLKFLNLTSNSLDNDSLPSSKEVPSVPNEYKEDVRRQFIVARLPNIKKLNGSSVKTEEREGAERAFVRYYMDKEEKPQRYYELESVYGRLDPLAEVKMRDTSVLNMKVTCEDKEEFMDVNIQQTVRQFKKLLQNFVGLPPSKFKLIHQEMLDGQLLHEWCLNDGRTLSTCNIREGDQFAVVFSNIRNAKVTFC